MFKITFVTILVGGFHRLLISWLVVLNILYLSPIFRDGWLRGCRGKVSRVEGEAKAMEANSWPGSWGESRSTMQLCAMSTARNWLPTMGIGVKSHHIGLFNVTSYITFITSTAHPSGMMLQVLRCGWGVQAFPTVYALNQSYQFTVLAKALTTAAANFSSAAISESASIFEKTQLQPSIIGESYGFLYFSHDPIQRSSISSAQEPGNRRKMSQAF